MSITDDDPILVTKGVHAPEGFALKPDADARATLAKALGIRGIKKLTFQGEVQPDGKRDLCLQAKLGATVIQECVVTGDPVTTRLDEPVLRRYLSDFADPEGEEAEMPEDDTAESLPATLDLAEVMTEALALALPPWPRADGVEPVDITITEPGKAPLTAEEIKPFAALKSLRNSLQDKDSDKG